MSVHITMHMKTKNLESMFKNIRRLPQFLEKHIREDAEMILRRARKYAPKDTRMLVRNASINRVGSMQYVILFERFAPWKGRLFDVAKWLHDPELFNRKTYKPSHPGTGPKYLLQATNELRDDIFDQFKKDFDEFLRKSVRYDYVHEGSQET